VIAALPQIRAGKLKPLAILAPRRHAQLPDVPTIVEEGYPDLTVATWFGLFVPAHTPPEVVQRINAEVMQALRSPEVLERYGKMGVDPVAPHTPAEFAAFFRREVERWGKVIREANVRIE
jgi:tripartite-type tricarboxylate transporter receptor subunit TctC